jgi:aspartate 1-decarboxylase
MSPPLMEAADILEFEQVHVYSITNGARFETYAMRGGPGEICLNGAAARLGQRGDTIIILTYVDVSDDEAARLSPRIVCVDPSNEVI